MPHPENPAPTPLARFTALFLPLLLYCALIFWLSSAPRHVPGPSFAFKDKILHFMAFGMVGILAFRATRLLPIASRTKRCALAVFYATCLGIADEVHQFFVPGRHADPMDILADALGALFWTVLYIQIRKHPSFRHPLL